MSVDLNAGRKWVRVRYVFDGPPSEAARDAASCAGAEVLADYPEGWDLAEEFVASRAPGPMDHLRLLVYHRCEDLWFEVATGHET